MGKAACLASLVLPLTAGGCMTAPLVGDPAVTVTASAETTPVGTVNDDAADDPAIWYNTANPARSMVAATDKKAGLYVYDLDGKTLSFAEGGLLNNVDLVDLGVHGGVIVIASDRTDPVRAMLRIFRLNTADGSLQLLGRADGGTGEAYGLCAAMVGNVLAVYSVLKDGTINEYRLELEGTPATVPMRTMSVATQPEGCVVDPRDGTLYVGEENAGIWRFAPGQSQGEMVAAIDNRQLVADVEGLAIALEGDTGGWLIASSQGDNAYARYRLPDMAPAGRFRIAAGTFGATEETDGIALDTRSFGGPFSDGLFVAQDGMNAPHAQNFKLVSWQAIEEALASWSQAPAP